MNRILDILIPRFITERVALIEANDGHLEIACALSDVRPGERFDAIATMRGVNLLGRIIFPRMIGAPDRGRSTSNRWTSRPARSAKEPRRSRYKAPSHLTTLYVDRPITGVMGAMWTPMSSANPAAPKDRSTRTSFSKRLIF